LHRGGEKRGDQRRTVPSSDLSPDAEKKKFYARKRRVAKIKVMTFRASTGEKERRIVFFPGERVRSSTEETCSKKGQGPRDVRVRQEEKKREIGKRGLRLILYCTGEGEREVYILLTCG